MVEFVGHRLGLVLYMGAQFAEAAEDLDAVTLNGPTDLYERFLSWIHLGARPRGQRA